MKVSTLVTALAERSLNMAYFPGELNSSALRSYFISGEVCDHKIGEITRETSSLCLLKDTGGKKKASPNKENSLGDGAHLQPLGLIEHFFCKSVLCIVVILL